MVVSLEVSFEGALSLGNEGFKLKSESVECLNCDSLCVWHMFLTFDVQTL
jgi:hypothetical protein